MKTKPKPSIETWKSWGMLPIFLLVLMITCVSATQSVAQTPNPAQTPGSITPNALSPSTPLDVPAQAPSFTGLFSPPYTPEQSLELTLFQYMWDRSAQTSSADIQTLNGKIVQTTKLVLDMLPAQGPQYTDFQSRSERVKRAIIAAHPH